MFRGLYAAASAMDAAGQNQETIAHNLAHASTPGHRKRGATFETFDRALGRAEPPTGDLLGVRATGVYHDFRPGPVAHTGHAFDLALGEPDTFFTVAAPDGRTLYTRNGSFHLTSEGRIVTQAGYPLLGEGGPLEVPTTASVVTVASDGLVAADGVPVSRVQLARATNLAALTEAAPTLFAAPPQAGVQTAEGRVMQGYKEGSNVQPADAMVQLILGARYYDAAQRALRTIAEAVQLNTRPQG